MQTFLVFTIVTVAAFYSAWKFIPADLRQTLAGQSAKYAQRMGVSSEQARRLESKLASAGTCGNCSSCNACGKESQPTTTSAATLIRIHKSSADR